MSELAQTGDSDYLDSPEDLRDRVEFLFYFGPHHSELDAKKFESYLAEADIYMPELNSQSDEIQRLFSKLGRGDRKAYERLYGLYASPFMRYLIGSIIARPNNRKLDVAFVDVPGTPYWADNMDQLELLLTQHRIMPTVNETLLTYSENCRKAAEIQSKRDEVIAQNISDYISHKLESEGMPPDRVLKIFASFGSFHVQILEKLQSKGIPAQMIPESSQLIDFRDDVIRLHEKGIEPPEELLQRALLSSAINSLVISDDSAKQTVVLREIAESLPAEKLDKFCQGLVDAIQSTGESSNEKLKRAIGAIMEHATGRSRLVPSEVEEYISNLSANGKNTV